MTLKISNQSFHSTDVDRIIEMAWEDRTPFEAISFQFGIKEKEVIVIMRSNLKASSIGSIFFILNKFSLLITLL